MEESVNGASDRLPLFNRAIHQVPPPPPPDPPPHTS